jgi:uncharacterized protein (TIGR03382 family)
MRHVVASLAAAALLVLPASSALAQYGAGGENLALSRPSTSAFARGSTLAVRREAEASTPKPASIALMAAGLIALGLALARRKDTLG